MKNLKNIAVVILITLSTNLFSQTYKLSQVSVQSDENKDMYLIQEEDYLSFDQVEIKWEETEAHLTFTNKGEVFLEETVSIISDFQQKYQYIFTLNELKEPRVFVFYSENKFNLEFRKNPKDKSTSLSFVKVQNN